MAAATAAKKSSSSSSSKSSGSSKSSSSSARKSTARSSTKSTSKAKSPELQAVEELRDKRASFDQPVVDTPVAIVEGGETQTVEGRAQKGDYDERITLTAEGSTILIEWGSKSAHLDREGAHSLMRHLSNLGKGL